MGQVEVDQGVHLVDVVRDHSDLVPGHVQAPQGRSFDLGARQVGELVVGEVHVCPQLVQRLVDLADLWVENLLVTIFCFIYSFHSISINNILF